MYSTQEKILHRSFVYIDDSEFSFFADYILSSCSATAYWNDQRLVGLFNFLKNINVKITGELVQCNTKRRR